MKGKSQLSATPSWNVKSRYCRGNYGLVLWVPWKEGMPTDKKYGYPFSLREIVVILRIAMSYLVNMNPPQSLG